MKLSEVKPLIDALADDLAQYGAERGRVDVEEARTALSTAFVAGVRSGLKYTSNAKFAEIFGGKAEKK